MRTEREQKRPSEPTYKAETIEHTPRARAAAGRVPRETAGPPRRAVRAPGTQRETAQTINLMEVLRRLLNERGSATLAEVQSAVKEELTQREIPLKPMTIEGEVELEARLIYAPSAEDHEVADVDAILKRLDQGIAAEHAAMGRLLERLVSRAPR